MNLEIKLIKILLKLLGKESYSAKIGEIKPNEKTTISQTASFCQELFKQEYVSLNEKIVKIKISNQGKKHINNNSLVDSDSTSQLKILRTCEENAIEVSKIRISSATKRDELIIKLKEEGLIIVTETKIIDVKLTEKALEFLGKEMVFIGNGNVTLPKSLINNYFNFIRDYYSKENLRSEITEKKEDKQEIVSTDKPNQEDILQAIIKLDKKINSGNYLPIFHLRNEYKNILTREELDNFLYNLENEGNISLSTLINISKYSTEESDAGISQSIGGTLFYITVEEI